MSSLGLRESRNLAHRQRRRRRLKFIATLAFLATLSFVSFELGKGLSDGELRWSEQEIARLREANTGLEKGIAELRKDAEISRVREAELRRRYAEDVPKGPRKDLLALVDGQLAKGAKADRLRFLINAASHEEKCDGQPVTKRFIVRTPLHNVGANGSVGFADSTMTVTAEGEPATDGAGNPQGWFDPAKPVVVEVARLGEKPGTVSGTLPLHHAVVLNGHEYRLTVVPGDSRGFVKVTADRCRFP